MLAAGDATRAKLPSPPNAAFVTRRPRRQRLIDLNPTGPSGAKPQRCGFAHSPGMKKPATAAVWTEENIDKWIADPKAMIPDSPMALAFPGMPDAGERADVIAYLKTVPAQ
jgi:cytochrome c